ncbi:hypothetical protein H2200_010935 [Cladophialophora chaetospira]|uniref:Esterase n=1 Tax=Cladophialophora chaetospira TaxID=386627 RepID=A0AA39CDY0_9EURO|nr:hypothetical protein H2200_010935 [Cladophialophora chaetospira]
MTSIQATLSSSSSEESIADLLQEESMETILHAYHPKRSLLLLEYNNTTATASPVSRVTPPQNVLLFIGGLFDNFRWPRYLDDLAALFPRDVPNQNWRLMQVQLSSNGRSWGLFDLDRDVEEISVAISYIRTTITKSSTSPIVLMGHSTGCQDLMHYLVSPVSPSSPRPNISGIILQAPVSDREAILHDVETDSAVKTAYETALSIASTTPKDKHKTTILPMHLTTPILGPAPVNISRFLSLASPDSPGTPSMDDYYSSDLLDERLASTFGAIGSLSHFLPSPTQTKTILILHGTDDKSVPPSVDKAALISRWKDALIKGKAALDPNTAIIPHANHDISGDSVEAREARLVKMRSAVLHYLDSVVGGVGPGSHGVWERDLDEIKEESYKRRLERRTSSLDESKL